MEALAMPESARLVALEDIIFKGLSTFVEVGNALTEIRDSKLYRIEHETFEDYCRGKWRMERRNAYDLMATAAVAKDVQCIAQIGRSTARTLAKVVPEQRVAVLTAAMQAEDSTQPTAAAVEAVVGKMAPKQKPTKEEKQKANFQKLQDNAEDSDQLWSAKESWERLSERERLNFDGWLCRNRRGSEVNRNPLRHARTALSELDNIRKDDYYYNDAFSEVREHIFALERDRPAWPDDADTTSRAMGHRRARVVIGLLNELHPDHHAHVIDLCSLWISAKIKRNEAEAKASRGAERSARAKAKRKTKNAPTLSTD